MEPSSLEKAVRARLDAAMAPIVGTQSDLDAAAVARLVDEKVGLVLPILRETMGDEGSPSLDAIYRAELEATRLNMKEMIGFMTDPAGQAAASAAKRELDAAAAASPAPDLQAEELERRVAELEARLDAGGAPTPQ